MAYSATALKALKTGIELAIPHEMSTPEWAETYRVVDRGARDGRWSNDTVPFLTEIMAAADDPAVRMIVLQKSSQVGGSELLNNIIGKRIHLNPRPMAYVAEKEDKATAWTQESFDTMVNATPVLKDLLRKEPEFNTQKFKSFVGGALLNILWATSPGELSSRPIQDLFLDEKAAFKPTKEGDPMKLGQARQKTYAGEELTVIISTPRRCECSAGETCNDVSHDFARGDQCEFYVPCPHCGEFQTLKFGGKDTNYGLKWDKESPETPYYLCEHCQCIIYEFDLHDMLLAGYWRASQPFTDVRSFKINQLYSPLMNGEAWTKIVSDFLEAQTDISKLEVLTNTVFGEVWKPVDRIEYEDLSWNLEQYPAAVPDGVLVLTAGVDVQKDRIEVEVVGWGRDHESWSIDYKVFEGSPGIEVTDDGDSDEEPLSSVWNDLAEFLQGSFISESGQAFRIQCVGIDSGYLSTVVYKFCKKYAAKRWFAVKGMSDPFKPLVSKPTLSGKNPKVRLFPIGTNAAKDDIFSALKVIENGPGKCHFPDRQPYNEEAHMKQLASERMVTHTRGGRTYRVYEPVAKGIRNEALDVRVYALAARTILNPNYEAIAKRRLRHAEPADRDVSIPLTHSENVSQKSEKTNTSKGPKPKFRVITNEFYGKTI